MPRLERKTVARGEAYGGVSMPLFHALGEEELQRSRARSAGEERARPRPRPYSPCGRTGHPSRRMSIFPSRSAARDDAAPPESRVEKLDRAAGPLDGDHIGSLGAVVDPHALARGRAERIHGEVRLAIGRVDDYPPAVRKLVYEEHR